MIEDKNPYEEVDVQAASTAESTAPNWFAILTAGGIYLVARVLCSYAFHFFYNSNINQDSKTAYHALTVIPWIAGAIYLACMVRYKWAMHGLVYSFIPLLALIIGVIFKSPETYPPLLVEVVLSQFCTIIATLLTMAVTRALLKRFDK